MEIEVIRAIERIVVVLFGGVSIVLGWQLFYIGVVSPQSGTLIGKGFKVSLQKVGPGIFFSLFGAAILVTSLVYGLSIETIDDTSIPGNRENVKKITKVSLSNSLQDSDIKRITVAINTLDLINIESSALYKNHKKAISAAIERLITYKERIARNKFTFDKLNTYSNCKESEDKKCKKLDSYKEVDQWFLETLL